MRLSLIILSSIILLAGCAESEGPVVNSAMSSKHMSNKTIPNNSIPNNPVPKKSEPNTIAESPMEQLAVEQQSRAVQNIVWAINVGGEEYKGFDGITYEADNGQIEGQVVSLPSIKGSQDPVLFQTFKENVTSVTRPLENGVYDLTFKFVEKPGVKNDDRIFDIYVEDQLVVAHLDVIRARDGRHSSSLVRSAVDLNVNDGELSIRLQPKKGQPSLAALIVRKKVEPAKNWQLVWADEFNYEGEPNPDKWNVEVWPKAKVNGEDQAYTDRSKNLNVENGVLKITAYREDYDKARYTSGRINSRGKGDLLYGRVDVRAKLPAGQGTWAAIWMMPSDPFSYATKCTTDADWQGNPECDAWPNSGEIDIMEHVGYDMQTVHGTVHTRAYYWVNGEQRKASVEAVNVNEEFHIYSLEWSPDRIDVLFDGSPYFSYMNEGEDWRTWPFDKPFHVILNLAIGGDWGRAGGPIDDTIFPVQMQVDYVRFYQKH